MNSSFANTLGNTKIQQAYDVVVEKRFDKVNKKANDAIQTFAQLVDEINKLQTESKGTTVNKEVATLGTDMSNSMVMVTRMLTAQLEALHGIVKPET